MLYLGKNYRIAADSMNLILQERRILKASDHGKQPKPENIGKETWDNIGYYGTLENLISGLVDLRVRESGMNDLMTVISAINETKAMIKETLAGLPKISQQSIVEQSPDSPELSTGIPHRKRGRPAKSEAK